MKECRVCKSPISEGDQFCHTCGTRLLFNPGNIPEESQHEFSGEGLCNDEQPSNEGNSSLSYSLPSITDDILVSTTSVLNGYSIMEYIGLVFGSSLYSSISKENTQNDEVAIECIEKSNQVALNRMIEHGKQLGATAIIGITMQQTLGNGSIIVSFCGTAVTITPEDTNKATIPTSPNDALIVEDSLSEETLNDLQEEILADHPEETFLSEIQNINDIIEIWNVWKNTGLEEDYPEVDTLLFKRKREAQSFGKLTRTQIEKIKHDLDSLLSNSNEYENTGDNPSPEIEFLNAVEEAESISEIWDIWKELDLFIKYPEANELLSRELEKECTFGALTKTQINKLIRTLNSIITM